MQYWIVVGYYSDGRVWGENCILASSMNQALIQACKDAMHPDQLTIVAIVDWETGAIHSPADEDMFTRRASDILATVV